MLVEDLMTTDIVTCDVDSSLQTAAVRMLEHGVGSVVITSEGSPFGIVTETDALHAGAATDRPFGDIAVEEVLSHPLVTTTPDATIRKAVNQMKDNDVKKLPVVEDLDLVGIITRTDIVGHYGEFIREAHAIDDQRERWEARRADVEEF